MSFVRSTVSGVRVTTRILALLPPGITVFFGPALPLAHAALVPTSDTLGAGGTPIRSYRPDPRDTDDNGILDAYQDGLDGRWSSARDAAQKAGLAGNGNNGVGTTSGGPTQTPAQQEAAALAAVIASNDGGLPPLDSDHDGFSDYEEKWKHDQLPGGINLSINAYDKSKHPPAYRYVIVDLGLARNALISKRNGWVPT